MLQPGAGDLRSRLARRALLAPVALAAAAPRRAIRRCPYQLVCCYLVRCHSCKDIFLTSKMASFGVHFFLKEIAWVSNWNGLWWLYNTWLYDIIWHDKDLWAGPKPLGFDPHPSRFWKDFSVNELRSANHPVWMGRLMVGWFYHPFLVLGHGLWLWSYWPHVPDVLFLGTSLRKGSIFHATKPMVSSFNYPLVS